MNIGIHSEAFRGAMGGTEFCVAILAEALGRRHEVEIVHHRESMNVESLNNTFGVQLDDIRLRYIPRSFDIWGNGRWPTERYQQTRNLNSHLSERYDLFVTFTHGVPPFCHAATGVVVVLFPSFVRPNEWPWRTSGSNRLKRLVDRGRVAYYDWEWRRRFGTYQHHLAISRFTQDWTKRWWGIDCDVLYPPVNTEFETRQKTPSIVSVGRFVPMKKQDVMLQAFRALSQQGLIDWRFQCVGAVDTRPQIAPYWATIQQLASSAQINLVPDADFSHIRRIYEEGSIFWHATGFGEDADANPAAMEHFGITTAEAMAAGCVPVVINRGGQPELVQHGVNGFVWNTLDELKAFTRRLIDDEALRTRMSGAARQQAAKFSQEQFVSRFLKLTGLTTEAPRAETPPQVAHQKSSYSPGPATAAAHCEE